MRNSRGGFSGNYARSGSRTQNEAARLAEVFRPDLKKHGLAFAVVEVFSNIFKNNGILGGIGISVLILWRNFIVEPFERLRQELREENKKPLRLEGFEDVRRHKRDFSIPVLMGVLMVFGLVLMYMLSPQWVKFLNQSYGASVEPYSFFTKQLLMYGVGVAAFVFCASISLKFLYQKSAWVLGAGFAICLLLFGLGWLENLSKSNIPLVKCDKGACRWFEAGPVSIQPAEIIKFGVMLAMAVFLGRKISQRRVNNWRESLIPSAFLVAAMAILIVVPPQKDLGTALSAVAIVVFQYFLAGLSKRNLTIFAIIGVLAIAGFIFAAPHRRERVSTFTREEDCSNLQDESKREAYQICRAKIAIGSGGLLGSGLGKSISTAGYLPEMINDSVFAATGEIVGFVGLVALLGVYFALIYRILRISNFMPNPTTRLLAAGIAGWITAHTLMNVFAITGLAPLTGITIPLISYGGTSIVVMSSILGLAYNASGYTSFKKNKEYKEAEDENLGSRRRLRRSRDSRRGSF